MIFRPICEKKVGNKILLLILLEGKDITNLENLGFCYCSSNKTDKVKNFQSKFSGMKFQEYFKKFEFRCSFAEFWGKIYNFFNYRNAILLTTSCVFIISDYIITFWYSHLYVLISELIQNKSAPNQRCSTLKK